MPDDPQFVDSNQRNQRVASAAQPLNQIGLCRSRKGGDMELSDCVRILGPGVADGDRQTVLMSGASSAFMPTTL